jgi:extracellular elastinolytic metalloproteinase
MMLCTASLAVAAGSGARNFDARVQFNEGVAVQPSHDQLEKIEDLRRATAAAVSFDPVTGATRSLTSHVGFLTGERAGSAAEVAVGFVTERARSLGLEVSDLSGFAVADAVVSSVTGATHVYLQQMHQGLPVYNGLLQVNVSAAGNVASVNNAFLPAIAGAAGDRQPRLDADQAVSRAAKHLGMNRTAQAAGAARLMWLPVRRGDARLVWNFQLETADLLHYYDFTVDARTGQVWTRFDWVAEADYRVYEQPVESPNHTSPTPPADGRTLEVDPQDATASPFGWHDTNGAAGAEFTITRGNNVHAYEDTDGNNSPPASDVDCGGSLSCDFPIDLTSAPSAYIGASVTNLFYWNNIIHDIQYQYGFNEAAGSFQVNNYGGGGAGNDDVRAEAQDGGGNCNANFFTPTDGSRPRMQMYTCTNTNPAADGDLDNGVIVHEYGHGISNRQVGGPNNTSCLGNRQQMGEGWSDFLAMAYTAEVGAAGTDARGMGTYLFGQPANGPGIRAFPYSTDFGVNPQTFSSIQGASVPHGVGSVWATIVWEAYWELVDFHGFDANLYNATGGSGNQRMMLYVNEGMKNTACGPTFLDARDGIITAATMLNNGEDVCRLWDAFARRGLGVDATTPSPNVAKGTDGFAVPAECSSPPVCGDTICDPGEDECSCAVDCGLPPSMELVGQTCNDGIDNDCDQLTDCDDTLDCSTDSSCLACTLGQNGDSCSVDADCCSNKCKNGTCRGN